jgi:hypothetical protein
MKNYNLNLNVFKLLIIVIIIINYSYFSSKIFLFSDNLIFNSNQQIIAEIEKNYFFRDKKYTYHCIRNIGFLSKHDNSIKIIQGNEIIINNNENDSLKIKDIDEFYMIVEKYSIWDIVKTKDFLQISISANTFNLNFDTKILVKKYSDYNNLNLNYSDVKSEYYRILVNGNMKYEKLDSNIYLITGKDATRIY